MKSIAKKVLIIAFVIVFFVFCSFINYRDISSYDIVSGIAIDYENDMWTVTCEICLPSSSNDFASKAEYVKGSDFTIEKALYQAGLDSTNILYTDSVQLYLISEQAARMPQLNEYLLSSECNLRAVAVTTKGRAADILTKEKESNQRAKSLALADKLKSLGKELNCAKPHVMTFVKGKTDIVIFEDGKANKRS